MKQVGEKFLTELQNELKNHPNCAEIMTDYEAYVHDLIEDSPDGNHTYEMLVERMGSPKELAKSWREEMNITPRKTKWIFFLGNALIFAIGIFITLGYHVFEVAWIGQVWHALTSIVTVIIVVYTLFWGLLGYEIGKEFGDRGKILLKKTFILSIIPNVILMLLVIFEIIPLQWFQPYLTVPFIILCVILTALFYPVSLLGYKWGRKTSV